MTPKNRNTAAERKFSRRQRKAYNAIIADRKEIVKAVADLEKIRPYEPNVVKAAWNIFGKSYLYRIKYNTYKKDRMETEKIRTDGRQLYIDDLEEN